MPTFDLIVKVDGDDESVSYDQRRIRVQELEVSSWRNPGDAYGQAVLDDEMWRIVRVTGAPDGLAQMLVGPDALDQEDLGKGFMPRRKLYYLIFEVRPRDAGRADPWDAIIPFDELVYVQKEPEARDLSGYPVEGMP